MPFSDYSNTPASNVNIGDSPTTFIGPNMPRDNVRPALQQFAADGRDLYDTVIAMGADGTLPAYIAAGTGAVSRTALSKMRESLSVKDFGAVGDGVTDDTAAIQLAFNAMASYATRSLHFPAGIYCVSATITAPSSLVSAEFIGSSGYDGTLGPINDSLRTCFKWIGSSSTSAVVKFDRAIGVRWSGISINCNYLVRFGLQFMSSIATTGSVKNIIENCSIHYALHDGIIMGEEGEPTAVPGQRQFFGNVFRNLTMYGCGQAAIHINEYNADQQMFDTVMVYLDDAGVPQNALYGIWFDSGGQHSTLINCQTGGLNVVGGNAGTGYFIYNKKAGSTTGGAFGLEVINCWQEGAGGLYYGVTSINDNKAFVFEHCASFTSDTANRSVYIDKGTSSAIPFSFIGCSFASDIEIASATFYREHLAVINCSFAAGKGVIDPNGKKITNKFQNDATVTANTITVSRFADSAFQILTANVNTITWQGVTQAGGEFTLIVKQDATGGRTINFAASGQFSSTPTIPAPNAAANAVTTYKFASDGTLLYLVDVRNT